MAIKSRVQAFDAGLKAAESDLSVPLLRTLLAVAMNSHLSVSELADAISVPQQTASRYVGILQGRYQTSDSSSSFARQPLLAHQTSGVDLRRYELVLTGHGAKRLKSILDQVYPKGGLNE